VIFLKKLHRMEVERANSWYVYTVFLFAVTIHRIDLVQPILQRLQRKAHQTYVDTHSGLPPTIHGDIFSPRKEKKDELSIFSGQTHTVATKSASLRSSRSSSNLGAPPSSAASSSSFTATDRSSPPRQNFTAIPSFATVHPNLVDELHCFDGRLNAQIHNAYYVNNDDFARTLLENSNQLPQRQQQQAFNPSNPPDQNAHGGTALRLSPGYLLPQSQSQSQNHDTISNQHENHHENHQKQNPTQSHMHLHSHDPPHPQSQNQIPDQNQIQAQYQVPTAPQVYHQQDMYNTAPPAYSHSHYPNQDAVVNYPPHNGTYDARSRSSSLQHWASAQPPVGYNHHPYPPPQNGNGYYHHHNPGPGQQGYMNNPPGQYYPESTPPSATTDDHSLQETWTSFMYQVGSPRQFLED
jgi:hypothetical protein